MTKSIESEHKLAVVTGASSGIGLSIAEKLSNMGFDVYGIGRSFVAGEYNFHTVECDLLDSGSLESVIKLISSRGDISVLVNNAGVAYYGLHGNLSSESISLMSRTNLELPMRLCNSFLPSLIKSKGYIINISSVTAVSNENTHGACYGALKAGLTSFGHSLFAEYRKQGLKVVTIQPDMTDTNLYRNANFGPSEEEYCSLIPEDVARCVETILTSRDGVVITDITLRPQFHRIDKK